MHSTPRRASKSIALALIGSIGILWGFKSCTRSDDPDDPYAATQPSGGSGYYDSSHRGHAYHNSGFSSSSHGFSSFGSSSHSSGTSRGGFGSSGHSHGGGGSA